MPAAQISSAALNEKVPEKIESRVNGGLASSSRSS